MTEPDNLVMDEVAADHPIRQAGLIGLRHDRAGPGEVPAAALHELGECRLLGRRVGRLSVLDSHADVRVGGAIANKFDVVDALEGPLDEAASQTGL